MLILYVHAFDVRTLGCLLGFPGALRLPKLLIHSLLAQDNGCLLSLPRRVTGLARVEVFMLGVHATSQPRRLGRVK